MAVDENQGKRQPKGVAALWRSIFSGFSPSDKTDRNIAIDSGNHTSFVHSAADMDPATASEKGGLAGGQASSHVREFFLPNERFARYRIFQDMADDALISATLDMHLAHALSVNHMTGKIITIESESDEFKQMAEEVANDLEEIINKNIVDWARMAAIFGVNYIRPFGEWGLGVVDIESDYYTMPIHIREYVRGGHLAGFSSEYLKKKVGQEDIVLAEPWALVPVKIPYWRPNLNKEPENRSGVRYSLYDDMHRRTPIETQNYGTSFLEAAYSPWMDLMDALRALKGSRYNASRIDRFITLGMENLDPVRAAKYLNTVGTQIKKDIEAEAKMAIKTGTRPSVWNSIIPALTGGKNGVTVDTQTVSPDIAHIEDVMFRLKQVASSLGIDPSMLGWGDLMSGGLGDGGFFRMSIQATLRANWLRIACKESILRLIDIHIMYKYQKAFPAGQRPITVKFHSLNTAIAIEESETMQNRAEMATAVATLLDMVEQSPVGKSDTFKSMMLNDTLQIPEEMSAKIMEELKAAAEQLAKEQKESMMESIGFTGDSDSFNEYLAREIHSQMLKFLGE